WNIKYTGKYLTYKKWNSENVLMYDAPDKDCIFKISINNGDATIKNNTKGLIKNYFRYNGSFGYYSSGTVQIYKKQRRANELSLSATSATTTTADLDGNFHSYVTLTNPNNLSPITYKSSNTGVAEVNEQGDVKVNKSGETTITVSYAGNDTYTQAELSYTLTINKLANGITIDKTSVAADLNGYKGEAKQYVSLTNPNNLPITYTSSNPYVATVDESGNVKLVSWGKTTITVSYPGSEVYESATTSYELNVINSESNYDRKLIEFVAGTDKGKEGGLPTLFTKAESLTKDVVNLHATTTTLASNPYHFAGGSTSKISVTKGNIVKIEFYGSNLTRLNCTSEGTFDKQSNIACWLGSAKEVSFNNTQTQINYADVTNIRVYVEYPNVKTFEYNENEANNIEAWEISDITLNRTLVADKWNTLCVPFAISEEEIKANFGEGTLVEKFDAVNGNTVNFANATSIEAGVPYLIKPTVAGTTYTFNGKEVSADTPKVEGNADVTFKGIYSPTDITNNGTVKAAGVTEGGKVLFVNAGSQTKAFRCFFTISDNASITPAMLKISIKGVETAINSIVMDNSNATDNAVYNLQGQRVNGNSLTKGIYIKNGKKFAVK
ncbi:MAG: Ig-like domain-containing protein, partial [Prevotella sp.]|nr:Ig-like domain-containing protein [Prevotella sp.]